MTLEQALSGASRLRNRTIGRVFKELKLIEQWGSGLRRIIHECEQHGVQPPRFEEIGNQFRLTLYNTPQSDPVILYWEEKLLESLKTASRISTSEAARLWDVTTRTARTRLRSMLVRGMVARIGTSEKDPGAAYTLKNLK